MRRRNKSLKNSDVSRGWPRHARPVFYIRPAEQARQQPSAADSGDAVFSTETRLVPLNVTVTDKSGHLVTNLPQSAFQVYENGVLQHDQALQARRRSRLLGLIIDNSGSMREKRQARGIGRAGAGEGFQPAGRGLHRQFQRRGLSRRRFHQRHQGDGAGLTKIDSRGGTAMRDAIRMSIDHLKEKAKRDKKVILVVTDGNDNASTMSLEALVRLAQQDDVLIYAIGLLSEEEKREASKAKRALNLLAESTGGEVFYPKDVSEVDTHRPRGGARHPQPVHHRLHAHQHGAGWDVPPDQGGGQGAGQSGGAHRSGYYAHGQAGPKPTGATEPVLIAGIGLAWRLRRATGCVPGAAPICAGASKRGRESRPRASLPRSFLRFAWKHRADLMRYLRWADANSRNLSGSW